jgi:hypothetical protein
MGVILSLCNIEKHVTDNPLSENGLGITPRTDMLHDGTGTIFTRRDYIC